MTKYVSLEHSIRLVCEDKVERFHKVGVTYTDAGEKTMKHVRVKAKSEAHALEKAKAHFKKKGYRIHDAIHAGVMKEDISNTDKFVGDKKPVARPPVRITPDATRDAQDKSVSFSRANQKTSQTAGNNVEEGVIGDTIEKGRKWVQDKVKDSPTFKAAQEFGHNLPGYEDAKDAKQHFAKGEYVDAAKSTLHSLGKAAATGAAVAAGGYAASKAIPALATGAAVNALTGSGGSTANPSNQQSNAPNAKGQDYHRPKTGVSRVKRHRVHESVGTEEREEIKNVPRKENNSRDKVEYVDRETLPTSRNEKLTRQSEIQRKVIDEESKRKADIVKEVRKEKLGADPLRSKNVNDPLGDGKTRKYGEVVINPPLDYKNLLNTSN